MLTRGCGVGNYRKEHVRSYKGEAYGNVDGYRVDHHRHPRVLVLPLGGFVLLCPHGAEGGRGRGFYYYVPGTVQETGEEGQEDSTNEFADWGREGVRGGEGKGGVKLKEWRRAYRRP